ncbi:MAG: Rrf2 family transcriptional regulator [Gammaproteobacteria bacterium]|nr:Rrf2 family transcriptional regulator [Gammaproteobacteria bacterium]
MRIPGKSRYAISAMIDLALHNDVRPLTIAEIAENQRISLSYLEQLFADLRKSGLVKGTRGPGGGYRLSRGVGEINIAQIILAVDDKAQELMEDTGNYLPFEMWGDLSTKIFSYIESISLADCIANEKAKSSSHASEQPTISQESADLSPA